MEVERTDRPEEAWCHGKEVSKWRALWMEVWVEVYSLVCGYWHDSHKNDQRGEASKDPEDGTWTRGSSPPCHELSRELRGKETWSGRLLMRKETPIMKSLNLKCIGHLTWKNILLLLFGRIKCSPPQPHPNSTSMASGKMVPEETGARWEQLWKIVAFSPIWIIMNSDFAISYGCVP